MNERSEAWRKIAPNSHRRADEAMSEARRLFNMGDMSGCMSSLGEAIAAVGGVMAADAQSSCHVGHVGPGSVGIHHGPLVITNAGPRGRR